MENDEYSCSLKLANNSSILGVSLDYSFDDDLSFVGFEAEKTWQLDASSSTSAILTSDKEITSDSNLGVLSFKPTSDVKVDEQYKISVLAKVVYSDDINNYKKLNETNSLITISDITSIIDYVKVGDNNLELQNDNNNYTSIVENNITSVKLESGINSKFSNLKYGENYGNRIISELNIGDNINYLTIESNGIEIIRLSINVNRKTESGSIISSGEENISENPPTGIASIFIILLILILSVIGFTKFNKKQLFGGN